MTTDPPAVTRQRQLIEALRDPARFPHPVDTVEHRETHISHVLLAGEYAYKIKKPLDLGFLDFSTLERRAHYCAEEIRLNGRLAPDIYLDVVAITGTPAAPVIGGEGDAIEFAVRMRRFDEAQCLDQRLTTHGGDHGATIAAVAERIARFHETEAAVCTTGDAGTVATVAAPMRENFRQILQHVEDPGESARLHHLAEWTEARLQALAPILASRRDQGRIRECHGDMHLANMVLTEGGVTIFDGIEFSESLRWIDVASDLAFLVMDLDRLGAGGLGGLALDQWLAATGDYGALGVIRLYLVYRAMVRAKINAIRATQSAGTEEADDARARYQTHVGLAERYARAWAPALVLTRGVAGTGKSTAAARLVERIGAIRLRSDVERHRLYGGAPPEIRYGEAANDAVHARLESIAARALDAGWPVVVDATFIERRRRAPFLALARERGIPLRILDLQLAPALRDERIRARAAAGNDPSEADTAIAARQLESLEPLTEEEAADALAVDNDGTQPRVPATGLDHGRGLAPDR